ncbi:epoxide hydrolase family protein [uncultured Jatrophihabitans sp.]|uniref:epoxide hydrolase family protein n=1 Tax=uncultured Jatrophihabitans sp. TaxID=1610747 RepID=UPI0035C99188
MSYTTEPTPTRPLLDVPEADVDDLRARLGNTRWARPWPLEAWQAGTDPDLLQRLVAHWADGYDWRAREAEINALPSHFTTLDGVDLHYLRFDAERTDARPIVLTNGWPSTFYELVGLARRLAHPSEFGGSADDACTVVVPSLPGFTLSQQRPSIDRTPPVHELWHRLMHDELGFERYGAHGGDLGVGITSRLAQAHPEAVVGIHLMDVERPLRSDVADLTDEERAFLDAGTRWSNEQGAYAHQQRTKPLTLAQGLSDSPAGLLAWIVEKYRDWSDCNGDVSSRFSHDFLLTQASLYWFTDTISTSFRQYYEGGHGLLGPIERVDVPTGLALFPADLGGRVPRSWAERTYNVTRYTTMPRGGHFAPHEEPALLAGDITAFFDGLG